MTPRHPLLHPATKPLIAVLALGPLIWLFSAAALNQLGANPAEALLRATGLWTLRFLCLVLLITPLRWWTGRAEWARLRRMLGLYTFFYAVLHGLAYAWLDMGFDLNAINRDLSKRPFALVGFACLVLLLPLAATSFNRAIKMLGAARWRRLHQLIYLITPLAMLHFFWVRASKHRWGEVLIYGAILGGLLGVRVVRTWRARRTHRA